MPSDLPYNLENGTQRTTYSQCRQDATLLSLFKGALGDMRHDGFFVESGARDGEAGSNTLLYELRFGWNGLLVEPDPKECEALRKKHRRAHSFCGALSPTPRAETLRFDASHDGLSHSDAMGSIEVQAQPLQALLGVLGQSTVDLWSLDIEGSEAAVLQATDFDKIEVGVLLVETNHMPSEELITIQEFLKGKGFKELGKTYHQGEPLDHVFVNKRYYRARGLQVPSGLPKCC